MLKRLLKYDMRAISRIACPIYLASGLISILCCAVLYFAFGFAEEIDTVFSALMLTGGVYLVGILMIIAMVAIMGITVIGRYYRSIFTDEGYLNMVIPVSKKVFLNSKIISSVIWVALSAIVAGACLVVSVLLPTLLYDTSLISEAVDILREEGGFNGEDKALLVSALLMQLAVALFSLVKDVMLVITAITVGAVVFKRFRICACILLYFGITFVEEAFTMLIKSLIASVTSSSPWLTLTVNVMLEIIVVSVTFAIGYLVSLFVLDKKLNLE